MRAGASARPRRGSARGTRVDSTRYAAIKLSVPARLGLESCAACVLKFEPPSPIRLDGAPGADRAVAVDHGAVAVGHRGESRIADSMAEARRPREARNTCPQRAGTAAARGAAPRSGAARPGPPGSTRQSLSQGPTTPPGRQPLGLVAALATPAPQPPSAHPPPQGCLSHLKCTQAPPLVTLPSHGLASHDDALLTELDRDAEWGVQSQVAPVQAGQPGPTNKESCCTIAAGRN